MKNCRDIRRELSAYLDGELTPSQRAEVETHVASCARCQRELLEMKALVTGVAALPKMQPAPRFLAEVRRKIAREDHEASTWQDHIFRPLWLKIPLEIAALIVIIGLIVNGEHPLSTQKTAPVELAKAENSENGHVNDASSEVAGKPVATDILKSRIADQAPAAEPGQDGREAPGASAVPSPQLEALEKDEKSVNASETPGLTVAADKRQFANQSATSEMMAGGGESQAVGGAKRAPALHSSGELSATPPSSPWPAAGAAGSMELAQSKPGETVTVHGRDFDDVRSRAQRLAARCSGRIIDVPQSKEATGRFLVELPQEYVAAFKLELLKTSGSSATLDKGTAGGQSGSTDRIAPSTGVLTGSAATNNSINAPGPFGLGNDATATAPTAILEIWVVPPTN